MAPRMGELHSRHLRLVQVEPVPVREQPPHPEPAQRGGLQPQEPHGLQEGGQAEGLAQRPVLDDLRALQLHLQEPRLQPRHGEDLPADHDAVHALELPGVDPPGLHLRDGPHPDAPRPLLGPPGVPHRVRQVPQRDRVPPRGRAAVPAAARALLPGRGGEDPAAAGGHAAGLRHAARAAADLLGGLPQPGRAAADGLPQAQHGRHGGAAGLHDPRAEVPGPHIHGPQRGDLQDLCRVLADLQRADLP
mmetsp:Transcript_56636/g.165655  ORF Transcript_56636/g.165655 Transcript_56636/m.165655 type:complete len:247 (+) Transcript_56636:422-1162(+)